MREETIDFELFSLETEQEEWVIGSNCEGIVDRGTFYAILTDDDIVEVDKAEVINIEYDD